MTYTVSEMARLLNISPSAIRYYEREGMLPGVERSPGGIRVLTEKDYRWLKLITCLKRAGMPLKEIHRYIQLVLQGNDTVEIRLRMFLEQRVRIEQQMAELQKTLDVVNYKCWYYETAKKAGSEDVPKNMPDEELPENLRAIRHSLRHPDK